MKSKHSKQYSGGRRILLKGALAGAASLALPPLAITAKAADQARFQSLGADLALLTVGGANVLALRAPGGLVLVDSGPWGHGAELREGLRGFSGGRGGEGVRTLFNTHWHLDQCGSNQALGSEGARIIAHEKTRLRLSTRYYLPHEERYREPLPEAGRPVETFFTKERMEAGSERIDYGYLIQAHTDGDIYVYFREANVLAVGDAASPERDPEHDWYGGGWIGGRLDSLDLLLGISDDDTRIVPAYGPVISRADLRAEREMMQHLYDRMVDLIREGKTARDMLEEGLMDELPRQFEDPYKFLYDAHKGLWAHHNKLEPNIV